MGRVRRPQATTRWRAVVIGAALVVSASGIGVGVISPSAALAQPASGPAAEQGMPEVREVRTVWTDEFGTAHPTGLAYDPSRREFLVAGEEPAGTTVLRLGPDEERLGGFRLPPMTDPETLAFDETRERLTAIDRGDQIEVPARALERGRPPTERTPIEALELGAPESATFDAQRDTWFVLDGDADTVAVVSDDDLADAPERLELEPSDAERVIAFNASDNLLYVLDPHANRIDAVDLEGAIEESFSLGTVELTDPVAMTFAPSTDLTDDPENLNLYIADAGDNATLGGVTEVSLAVVAALAVPVDTAGHVQTIETSSWTPASPDPAGIVWMPAADELAVTDSEVNEETGAGWHDVNFWRSTRTGSVVGVGAWWGPNSAGSFSKEPTGLGFDAASNTLFVSDDSARRIFVVQRGPDGAFGTTDDVVGSVNTSILSSADTEDPEFDPMSGHLFFLDGNGMEIYRIDPVDGTFGNGNDVTSSFDISHLGPADFEGLTSNPERGTLYVGARTTGEIFEITHDGTPVRMIDADGVAGLEFISGLAMAPASTGGGQMHLWIVDRAVDNGADSDENDGRIFEISAPDIGGVPGNLPPVAVDDSASTMVDTAVGVAVLDNDLDPNGDPLTVTNLTQPADGTAQVNADETVNYTPDAGFTGTDSFTYTANDGEVDSAVATVTITVSEDEPVGSAPTFRSAASATITGASGSTLAIARPDGVQAGDLLLAQIRHRSLTTLTAPPGWTEVASINRSTAHHDVYYKVAGSNEPASYAFGQGANAGRMSGGIGAYAGVDPADPIDAWAASGVDTATLFAPDVTSTVNNAMVVRLWGWRGPSATGAGVGFNVPPAGVTERWTEQVGHANDDRNRVLAGDQVQAAAGPVGTAIATGSSSSAENRRSAFTVVLTPAGGGGVPGNLPPVAVDDSASTMVDTAVGVAVLDNDLDPNGDPLTVTNLTQPADGTAQVNADETVTYTPDAGFTGTDSFTYTANDGDVDSNVATVTITVSEDEPVGSAPTFRSASSATITKASGSTLAIARPDGVQAGDLLLAQIRHRSLTALTPPAGWTELTTITRSTAHHGVYYKVADGSEPASFGFNQGTDAGRMSGGIGAYAGVDPADPIDAWAASGVDTATLFAPDVTSTVNNAMVVRLWGWRGPSATDAGVGFNAPPAGVTERWTEQVVHSNDDRNRVLAGDQVQATAGPVGASTASGSASADENRRSAVTVVLAPAGGG